MLYRIFFLFSILFFAGCKKKLSPTEMLAGDHAKSWQRYQYQVGTNTPLLLNDCYSDDVWTFFNEGDLEVNISGTNCGVFGLTGNILYADWHFNSTNDTIIWKFTNSSNINTFKITSLDKDEMVLHQRVDSAGNTATDSSTIDMYNYFRAR